MTSRRRRPLPPEPEPELPEDNDLLSEILLRLPPQPSSLPRAPAVSRRWRGLASDPRYKEQTQVIASVYSSETGRWGDLVSTQRRSEDNRVDADVPAVMIGDSLFWKLTVNDILEFDLDKESLVLIPMPEEVIGQWPSLGNIWVLPAEDGGLGFLFVSGFSAQLWKRKADCDGVASWVRGRAIALDTLLSINSREREDPFVLGFVEENNMVLLWTSIGVFTVQLQSLEFKKLFGARAWYHFYPFECVYVAEVH